MNVLKVYYDHFSHRHFRVRNSSPQRPTKSSSIEWKCDNWKSIILDVMSRVCVWRRTGAKKNYNKIRKSTVFAASAALSRYTIRFGIAALLHIDCFLLDFMFILQNLFASVWFSVLVIRSIIIIFIIINGQIEIHFIFSSFCATCFFRSTQADAFLLLLLLPVLPSPWLFLCQRSVRLCLQNIFIQIFFLALCRIWR